MASVVGYTVDGLSGALARGESLTQIAAADAGARPSTESERRTLAVACGAHALHDGYSDLLYVLLPLWQTEFGLGYAEVGILRALYAGAMAGFQVPAGMLAERFGGRAPLAIGTMVAGIAYLIAGASTAFMVLAVALILGGLGSSVQHPIASSLVAHAFEGKRSRRALASYNFSGDIGKMALPAATAWLIALMPWRSATLVLGTIGLVAAAAVVYLLPHPADAVPPPKDPQNGARGLPLGDASRRGFPVLLLIGIIDSATRMGFLTFLPFLLKARGADLPTVGIALTLIFAGGAAGKLVCGYLGSRIGVIPTVFLTESLTAAGILALLPLSLTAGLVILPVIGVALNGTSSVLYGTVPELVPPERRGPAFCLFFTRAVWLWSVLSASVLPRRPIVPF